VSDNPRIEELRRRVQKDPASIAFAQLAEEYRRAANCKEAIAVCRAGLAIHPGYISARVTLGRALIEINDLVSAEVELEAVLQTAPDNLAALRALAEVHDRAGHPVEALELYRAALDLSGNDPALEQKIEKIANAMRVTAIATPRAEPPSPEVAPPAHVIEASDQAPALPALRRFLAAVQAYRRQRGVETSAAVARSAAHVIPLVPRPRRRSGLPELKRFLDSIHSYRQRQAV
jgi:tetratricopeptide (TPR) repeat protein